MIMAVPGQRIPARGGTFGTLPIKQITLIEQPQWDWAHIMLDGELIGYALTKHHRETWDALLNPAMIITNPTEPAWEACGRGVCCMNDGHEGECRQ